MYWIISLFHMKIVYSFLYLETDIANIWISVQYKCVFKKALNLILRCKIACMEVVFFFSIFLKFKLKTSFWTKLTTTNDYESFGCVNTVKITDLILLFEMQSITLFQMNCMQFEALKYLLKYQFRSNNFKSLIVVCLVQHCVSQM